MARYAIYGAGSLGTVLGAFITKNGGEVDLINRNKAHVEALNTKGAKIIGSIQQLRKIRAKACDITVKQIALDTKILGTLDVVRVIVHKNRFDRQDPAGITQMGKDRPIGLDRAADRRKDAAFKGRKAGDLMGVACEIA